MNINTDKLKEIILEEIYIDVDAETRKREVIEGRIIYCKILRDCGWTMSRIGSTINKNHATVVHYIRRFEENQDIYAEESFIMVNYAKVKNRFTRYLNKNFLSTMTRGELETKLEQLLNK